MINVCVIVAALIGYSKVTLAHEQTDAAAKAEADRKNAEIAAEAGETGGSYTDGTYPVTVLCEPDEDEDFEPYHLSASVVIKNDRVAEINNVTGDGDSGNNSYIKRAVNGTSGMAGMVSRIIGMAVTDMSGENAGAQVDQNLTELDTVSRATCTSKSIKEACREALRQAREKFLAETESARNEDGEDSAE